MINNDPLSLLKDIHVGPPSVSSWVWIGFIGSLLFIMILGLCLAWHYRRTRSRRLALSFLEDLKMRYAAPEDHHRFIQELNVMLKRYIKSKMTDVEAMTSFGDAWLVFLESKAPGLVFRKGPGQILSSGGYDPHIQIEIEPLYTLVKVWLKRSRL